MILGIEGTAHTISFALIDKKYRLVAQEKAIMKTKNQGLVPSKLFEHHIENAVKVFVKCIEKANARKDEIEAVAFSNAPGIPNSLKVTAVIARTISHKLGVPLLTVNHCFAHIESVRVLQKAKDFIAIFTSGANTQILTAKNKRYIVLGETLDIGIGNLFDSFARYLGYGFPGGPIIDKLYFKGKNLLELPYTVKGNDIVFSGLLTAAKKLVGKHRKEDICFSLMEYAFDMLLEASERLMKKTGKKNVLVSGGVAASKAFRKKLEAFAKDNKAKLYISPKELSMDNAYMIAIVGLLKYKHKQLDKNHEIKPYQRIDEFYAKWLKD